MADFTTTQLAPLIANAGVTQNVSISSPSTYAFGGGSGDGWAPTVPDASTASTASPGATTATPWAKYLFFAAVAYFILRRIL